MSFPIKYNKFKRFIIGSDALFWSVCAVVLLANLLFLNSEYAGPALFKTVSAPPSAPTLVIDAGHGGIDGGAVSSDGTKESDINLAVALRLEYIVRFCGHKTVMTRWDDSRKTDILSYSEREDLKERVKTVNAIDNAVLISIHQNYFPTAQPSGAQVLYSGADGSERLGRLIQSNLVSELDASNRRLAAPAPADLFITANTHCPAVLVECGFMSNNFEVLKLKDVKYQTSLAIIIACSYMQFIGEITNV